MTTTITSSFLSALFNEGNPVTKAPDSPTNSAAFMNELAQLENQPAQVVPNSGGAVWSPVSWGAQITTFTDNTTTMAETGHTARLDYEAITPDGTFDFESILTVCNTSMTPDEYNCTLSHAVNTSLTPFNSSADDGGNLEAFLADEQSMLAQANHPQSGETIVANTSMTFTPVNKAGLFGALMRGVSGLSSNPIPVTQSSPAPTHQENVCVPPSHCATPVAPEELSYSLSEASFTQIQNHENAYGKNETDILQQFSETISEQMGTPRSAFHPSQVNAEPPRNAHSHHHHEHHHERENTAHSVAV